MKHQKNLAIIKEYSGYDYTDLTQNFTKVYIRVEMQKIWVFV